MLTPPGRHSRGSLNEVEVSFGVGEFLHLLDLERLVFVGDDLCNIDRFAGLLYPDAGLNFAGNLSEEYPLSKCGY